MSGMRTAQWYNATWLIQYTNDMSFLISLCLPSLNWNDLYSYGEESFCSGMQQACLVGENLVKSLTNKWWIKKIIISQRTDWKGSVDRDPRNGLWEISPRVEFIPTFSSLDPRLKNLSTV